MLTGKLLKCLYPVMWVLIPFAFKGKKHIKIKPGFHLLIMVVIVNVLIRLLVFFGGVLYQRRYLYPIVIFAIIIVGGIGFINLAHILSELLNKYFADKRRPTWLTLVNLRIGLLTVIFIACVPKALKPQLDKKWLRNIPEIIRENRTSDKPVILISDLDDSRLGYYADAEFLVFAVRKNHTVRAETRYKSSSLPAYQELKEILTDDDYSTGIKLTGKGEFLVKLAEKYPRRRGYLYLTWGDDIPADIEIQIPVDEHKDIWRTIYKGKGKERIKLSGIKHKLHFRLFVNASPEQQYTLKEVSLYNREPWLIMQHQQGYYYQDWVLMKLPGGIKSFAGNISKLGGDNVFVLVSGQRKDFEQRFKRDNISFPLKFIKEYKIRKKGYFSLYQGCRN